MRLPVFWLHDHVRPELSTEALAARLDETGTEVKRIDRHGVGALERFVVGRVLEAEQHPGADRLRVCKVAVGGDDVAQIVCGAPNVAAGQTVAVARPGAVMPDGSELGAAKLRGVVSEGMILAEDELGIGTDHAGIIILEPDGLTPGTPLAGVLPIATDVLELEITPNRPDCLAVFGVAREVHAATGAPLGPAPWAEDPGSLEPEAATHPPAHVDVEDPDLCPRFTARVFEDVSIGPSPPWLKARLTAAGQRPISNVVDITNFVMLLTGQPLHAYDLDAIPNGRLIVRRAREGERLTTLDDVERILDPEVVVVCDEEGPSGIGGVMGGAGSEVANTTTRVLMEAATWHGPNIHRTSQRLGLRTEASARFEKQLSPESALEGQVVATRLMIDLCGARLVPGTIDVGGAGGTDIAPAPIRLREARVGRLLGAAIPRERCAEILRSLEFGVAGAPGGFDVSAPHFRRNDVTREADVIEEVARIHGVDRLPATYPSRPGGAALTPLQRLRRRAEDALAGRGLHEIAGWSFAAPDLADRLRLGAEDPRRRAVVLANPLAEDQSVLRTTLVGSLLDVARHNVSRGAGEVRLFEQGAVYLATGGGGLPDERRHLGALLLGPARPATWREPGPPAADVFAAKGVLEGLLDTLRVPWRVEQASEPFLHPGRAARILAGADAGPGEPVGWLGELHPLVAEAWDLDGFPSGAGFELDLDRALGHVPELARYAGVSTYPAVRQDLAVTVADDVPAQAVVDVVRGAGGDLLAGVGVFDVYTGVQAGEGRRSLALRLEFRAPDRTLTDAEADELRERIVAALGDRLGAVPRA